MNRCVVTTNITSTYYHLICYISGSCYKCKQAVTDPNDATQALGHLYHSRCFTCFSCGRELRGKRFYEVDEKTYCEEDYLYSGFQQSAERCSACRHLIIDMVSYSKIVISGVEIEFVSCDGSIVYSFYCPYRMFHQIR